ncbi:MAG TPA: helix-turn-helix domain-containing protein [Thermoanaerobaculia bacterium]|jgi:AraC-like DNA-binding protein|nr:helix-turn-helix domain-containing protein [Thermoanaerobaculia bacterium]
MIYRERLPSPELRELVERLWWLEGEAEEIVAEPIPPDGHAEIVVHAGEPFRETERGGGEPRQERVLLAGQTTRAVRVAPTGFARVAGARLRPDAAHALFGCPQWELTDRVADLRDVAPALARTLRDDVAGRERGEEMLSGLDAALSASASRLRRAERPVSPALRLAAERGGLVRVDDLARRMGVTPRQTERLFRERVGLSPKLFLRIVRFQRALSAIRARRRTAWADLAVALGFYDQSHLIRDFRGFAGGAPAAWSPSDESLAAVFSAVRREARGPSAEDVAFFQDAAGASA